MRCSKRAFTCVTHIQFVCQTYRGPWRSSWRSCFVCLNQSDSECICNRECFTSDGRVLRDTCVSVQETSLTLRSLWASGHQVLLSYDSQCAARHPELWPAIPYLWANKPTAEELESYLDWQKGLGRPGAFPEVVLLLTYQTSQCNDLQVKQHMGLNSSNPNKRKVCIWRLHVTILVWFRFSVLPEGLFVAGLNLTASRGHIALHPGQSLRTLTKQNWESLKSWLGEQSPGPQAQGLNIIAGDFVGPLPICPLVIALNKKLLRQKPD